MKKSTIISLFDIARSGVLDAMSILSTVSPVASDEDVLYVSNLTPDECIADFSSDENPEKKAISGFILSCIRYLDEIEPERRQNESVAFSLKTFRRNGFDFSFDVDDAIKKITTGAYKAGLEGFASSCMRFSDDGGTDPDIILWLSIIGRFSETSDPEISTMFKKAFDLRPELFARHACVADHKKTETDDSIPIKNDCDTAPSEETKNADSFDSFHEELAGLFERDQKEKSEILSVFIMVERLPKAYSDGIPLAFGLPKETKKESSLFDIALAESFDRFCSKRTGHPWDETSENERRDLFDFLDRKAKSLKEGPNFVRKGSSLSSVGFA